MSAHRAAEGRVAARCLLAALCGIPFATPARPANEEPVDPRPSPLVEQAESRLMQIDVSLDGPADELQTLTAADFRLKVHDSWIPSFAVDRFCPTPAADAARSPSPGISFVLYFDQPMLTLGGRAVAMDTARTLVRELLRRGDRVMIVSNAARLKIVEEWTDDEERLLSALDRLEQDRSQWDVYASEEASRVERIVDAINREENVQRAASLARAYQREELARSDKSLRRLAIVLTRLSEVDTRKAVVYFADILRQNPGEHYLAFFGLNLQRSMSTLSDVGSSSFFGGLAFDQVVNEAVSQGIRFYAVYGEGLVVPHDRERVGGPATSLVGTMPSSSRIRFRDAQNTLGSLASETGGHHFLRGESPGRMVGEILDDFRCLYTLSFDPRELPQDEPLRVIVRVERPGVTLRTAGRTLLASPAARLTSRLLSAFAVGGGKSLDVALGAHVVAVGFDKGAYAALLQISVPPATLPAATWELGATLIGGDRVLDEVSRTLSVSRAGVPLVLEREVSIRPGPHEIVAVAHESTRGFILSEHLEVAWPDPDRQALTCGPLALFQPIVGAFVRADATRTSGSLARATDDPVDTGQPTALLGLVCRGKKRRGMLQVERTLVGASAIDFPPLRFELERDRCAQVRDLIPADSLGPGFYRYEMRVIEDGATHDEAFREFEALEPEN